MTIIRSAYDEIDAVQLDASSDPGAKQSFKDECEINNIMAKYQTLGVIEHVAKHEAQYGFATSQSLRESIELQRQANEMFAELPSSTRKKFENSPEQFLDWVQNPENASKLDEMGEIHEPEPEPITAPTPAPPAEPAPAPE